MQNAIGISRDPGKRKLLAGIGYVSQFFFGGWFLFHGLNYWLGFYHDRTIEPGPGLVPALAASGLMAIVKAAEVLIGAALLCNLFVAMAIVLAWPITLTIAFVAASHGRIFGIIVAIIIIALNAIMTAGHLDRYRALLVPHAGKPWAWTGGTSASHAERIPLGIQLAGALAGLGAAIAITYATVSV